MPESMHFSTELSDINGADAVVISIGSQGLSSLMKEIDEFKPENKIFILCMKGIEIGTGKRLSEIVEESTSPTNKVAVWLGPGHPQEFVSGRPNCMVIDSKDDEVKRKLVSEFSSSLIRFYYGTDLIGNEIGAATKNVIGIAAGALDGLGISSLKGALMARAPREISRLIAAMGGDPVSVYGLCHLGDYEATVFSKHSHNRAFGEAFIKNESFDALAEGYYTVCALMNLAEKYNVELPICRAVYALLYENAQPKNILAELFDRKFRNEFY